MITDRYRCRECNYDWISFDDPVCCPACGLPTIRLLPQLEERACARCGARWRGVFGDSCSNCGATQDPQQTRSPQQLP